MVRKRLLYLLAIITMLMVVFVPGKVLAAPELVVDLAGSFTAEQISQLKQKAGELGAQYQMDIVIVTTNKTSGKSSMEFADDYFDYNGYGVGTDRDGILFLLDFENRQVYISTSGSGIKYLTDERINSILDDELIAFVQQGNNFGAAADFLNSTSTYLAAGIPGMQPNTLSLVDIGISIAASGLLGGGFFAGTKKQYKAKPGRSIFEYQKNSFVNFDITTDNLVNTYTTSRIIPVTTGRSGPFGGGSSTHTSGSGRTHGGGGRGF